MSSSTAGNDDLRSEQAYLTTLYERLDGLRARADERLRAILLESGGTPQGRAQREASRSHYAEQLAQMNAVENGLCFGRLDFADGAARYVGRLGLSAEEHDRDPLLVDWRSPAAEPFFGATHGNPMGLASRRRYRWAGGRVRDYWDEARPTLAAVEGIDGREG